MGTKGRVGTETFLGLDSGSFTALLDCGGKQLKCIPCFLFGLGGVVHVCAHACMHVYMHSPWVMGVSGGQRLVLGLSLNLAVLAADLADQ